MNEPDDLVREAMDGDIGGAFVVPSAKVRLPEHVTKLPKKSRRTDRNGDSDEQES